MKLANFLASIIRRAWKQIKNLIRRLLAFRGWIDWATPERSMVFPVALKCGYVKEAGALRIDQYEYG